MSKVMLLPHQLFDAERVIDAELAKDKKTRQACVETAQDYAENASELRRDADAVQLLKIVVVAALDAMCGELEAPASNESNPAARREAQNAQGAIASLAVSSVAGAFDVMEAAKNEEAKTLDLVVAALRRASESTREHSRSLA
jgi:hypothetical protein